MTIYLSNRDGNGKTNEEGHYRLLSKMTDGQTLSATDLKVVESSPLALSVSVSIGDYKIDTTSGYSYMGWLDAAATVTITTANPTNPRITAIVLYVDKGATTSASPPNNPGITKLMAVNGTAAGSPVSPNNTTIQSAVGAGNPFIRLADVLVGAGATTISNANITDTRTRIKLTDNVLENSNLAQYVGPLLFPVGSIYTNAVDNTNPATLLGFGTWTAFAQGRVPVGLNSGDSDFDTPLETGGAKTVSLTTDQLPAHSHVVDPPATSSSVNGYHTHVTNRDVAYTDDSSRRTGPSNAQQAYGFGDNNLLVPAGDHSHVIDIAAFNSANTGTGQAHTNLQPYIVVYMWRRTA